MHCLAVFGRKLVCRVYRRMGRDLQDQKLASAQEQDLARRARLVGLKRFFDELPQAGFQKAKMAQCLAGQRAGESGIAWGKSFQALKLEIQRPALAQGPGDNGKRRAPCGKAGVGHETM
jgi:hypothetical protein